MLILIIKMVFGLSTVKLLLFFPFEVFCGKYFETTYMYSKKKKKPNPFALQKHIKNNRAYGEIGLGQTTQILCN